MLVPAAGIIAWLALGPHLSFGVDWQLYVNTATATELIMMTTFLQNTKRRHRAYMHRCAAKLAAVESDLKEQLAVPGGEGVRLMVVAFTNACIIWQAYLERFLDVSRDGLTCDCRQCSMIDHTWV